MKKILALALTLIMLVGILASCGGGRIPEGMDGKTASQYLLANERLNSELLKNDGNIFETGKKVFENLASIAEENLIKYENGDIVYASSMSDTGSKTYSLDDGSKVTVTGNLFEWSGFEKYSNAHDYFASTTENITVSAMLGADLIDDIKKNVRVSNKWIKQGNEEYYLQVGENYELLFRRRTDEDFRITACIRYKDEAGNNVYEVYEMSGTDSSEMKVRDYMLYIPGQRFEFSTRMAKPGTDYWYSTNFMADNSKGFWEMVNVNNRVEYGQINVSYLALKDDVCYDAMCDTLSEYINNIVAISPDRNTDIMKVSPSPSGMRVELALGGFNGVEKVFYIGNEVSEDQDGDVWYDSISDDKEDDRFAAISSFCASVLTKNGTLISPDDTFLDESVEIAGATVALQSMGTAQTTGYYYGYTSHLSLYVKHVGTFSEQMQILRTFLDEAGIECKYSMDYVEGGLARAYEETQAFMKYYTWNGYTLNTEENIDAAFDIQDEKLVFAEREYEKVKDAEIISRSLVSTKNMYFGEVSAVATGAKYAYRTVTIDSVKVSTDDTVMFVENEPYVIKLALLDSEGMLVHVDYEGATETVFASANSFELEQRGIEIEIPSELSEGEYKLVAYISTADGIRSSMPSAFAFEEIHSESMISGATLMTVSSGEGNELVLSFAPSSSLSISVTSDKALSYSELYELASKGTYEKGAIIKTGAVIEVLNEETATWAPLDTEATGLNNGTYRIEYENKNADKAISGTVVFTLN